MFLRFYQGQIPSDKLSKMKTSPCWKQGLFPPTTMASANVISPQKKTKEQVSHHPRARTIHPPFQFLQTTPTTGRLPSPKTQVPLCPLLNHRQQHQSVGSDLPELGKSSGWRCCRCVKETTTEPDDVGTSTWWWRWGTARVSTLT